MLLSVIIVNYNVKYFLEHCLCSIIKASRNTKTEIIVIDNNSSDGSKDFFNNRFPEVFFIWNETNDGFAKANNKALKQAAGDYILFLNPDTIVAEDTFEKCISFIKSKNDRIACGVKMIDGNGNFLKESKRAFPAPATSFFKLSGLSWLFPKSKTFSKYHLGFIDENKNHIVDVLAGAFMMIPKSIINNTGGFDEKFFMYGEDIDLSYRIQEAGYKNFYFAETTIIHFKGESTKKESIKYVKMFYKAMSVFVKKYYGNAKAGLFNFFIQCGIYFRAALSAVSKFIKQIGLFLKNIFYDGQKSTNNKSLQTLVIATQQEFDTIISFFQKINNQRVFRLLNADNNISGAIINDTVKWYPIKEILVCEGFLSYKEIINLLPELPHHLQINFFNNDVFSLLETD